jgi:hypothetical protein
MVVLGFELRVSGLLGRSSTTRTTPSSMRKALWWETRQAAWVRTQGAGERGVAPPRSSDSTKEPGDSNHPLEPTHHSFYWEFRGSLHFSDLASYGVCRPSISAHRVDVMVGGRPRKAAIQTGTALSCKVLLCRASPSNVPITCYPRLSEKRKFQK